MAREKYRQERIEAIRNNLQKLNKMYKLRIHSCIGLLSQVFVIVIGNDVYLIKLLMHSNDVMKF